MRNGRAGMSDRSSYGRIRLVPAAQSIVIVVTPSRATNAEPIPGYFDARVEGSDQILVTSRQPFLNAARALIAMGCDPSAMLIMRHEGRGDPALQAPIGLAARLTVDEERKRSPRFKRWKPFHAGAGVSKIVARGMPSMFVTPSAKAA